MTPKSKRIHLIEKNHKKLIMIAEKMWESGLWNIPEATAKKLLEGSILFHEKPKAPSFFGGIIVNYRLEKEGRTKGLVTFTFEYQAGHRKVMEAPVGWSKEMKIVTKK